MIQNLLRHLGGIEHYGVVSLCLFGTIFLVVLLWTLFQKKSHLEYMSRVALDADQDQNQPQSDSHE